jgi:transcriptional regulator with XRE-family HTH domain
MDDVRFGGAIRQARLDRQWSQADLAAAAGLSRSTVVRVEAGDLDSMPLRTVRRIAAPVQIRVELTPRSRGAFVERIVNARHAALAERVLAWLGSVPGWVVRPEVSFNIWGERGAVDVLAWHAATATLIVIELKTAIVDVGELLGTLGRKVRLAPQIAAELGWRPRTVSTVLILGEGSTNRRRLAEHQATFRAVLPDDARRLRGWLRSPVGAVSLMTFLSDDRPGNARSGFATLSRLPTRPSATRGQVSRRAGRGAARR